MLSLNDINIAISYPIKIVANNYVARTVAKSNICVIMCIEGNWMKNVMEGILVRYTP